MLSRSQRLTRAQFENYFKTGKRYHTKHLQLIYSPTTNCSAAVVVGKKVSKKAVTRNSIRRCLYGVVYRSCVAKEKAGVYIIIAKPTVRILTRHELLAEAQALISSIR